jgi:hypothetical protein
MHLTWRSVCQAFSAAEFVQVAGARSLLGGLNIVAGRKRFCILASQRANKIDNAFANFRVVNPREGHVEMQPLSGRQEIRDIIGIGTLRNTDEPGFETCYWLKRRRAFKKIGRGNIERSRNLLESARANPVNALFIFLDLLKCQTQGFSQFFLAHAKHHAPHADAAADVAIDGVGGFFHEVWFQSPRFRRGHGRPERRNILWRPDTLYRKSGEISQKRRNIAKAAKYRKSGEISQKRRNIAKAAKYRKSGETHNRGLDFSREVTVSFKAAGGNRPPQLKMRALTVAKPYACNEWAAP